MPVTSGLLYMCGYYGSNSWSYCILNLILKLIVIHPHFICYAVYRTMDCVCDVTEHAAIHRYYVLCIVKCTPTMGSSSTLDFNVYYNSVLVRRYLNLCLCARHYKCIATWNRHRGSGHSQNWVHSHEPVLVPGGEIHSNNLVDNCPLVYKWLPSSHNHHD